MHLQYLQLNQTALRAAAYTLLGEQLVDSKTAENEVDAVSSGRLSILPYTYVCVYQYMKHNMRDSIAIVNKVG